MKKRILTLTVALCMLMSVFSAFSISVNAASTPSDWSLTEVNAAISEDLVTDKVTKDYQEEITREEFCELVVKLYEKLTGENAVVRNAPFSDTDNTEILKAYSLGIVKGVSDNEFAPNNNITRQEICVMLTRCIDVSIDKADTSYFVTNNFSDEDSIADWAIDSVNYAYSNRIIKGVGDNKIDPLGNTTCEQAILFCYRIFSSKDNFSKHEEDKYETVYLNYIKNNTEYFSRGIMLCDLNDDDIPELFSIAYDTEGDLVYYHEFKDNKVITPSGDSVKTYIDIDNLVRPTTFFEDLGHFIGIYRNKTTGQKALINSIADGSENDRFDIITYNGENLVLKDEGVKSTINNSWPINEKRDTVMSDYELANDELYTSFLLRGEFGGEYGSDPVESLKGLIEDFKKSETSTKYDKTTDGEFFCYIRNISVSDNEIELIPVAIITYEEYNNAINADKMFTLNEETMSIQLDDFLYSEYGIAHLYQMPNFEYQFYVPTEEYPTSVIEGYMENTPVKVKMSSDLKIRYGVSGEYDIDGTPMGYETLGRNQEYSISEYITHFAEYSMGSYYKAVIKDGELEFLDVMYHE